MEETPVVIRGTILVAGLPRGFLCIINWTIENNIGERERERGRETEKGTRVVEAVVVS